MNMTTQVYKSTLNKLFVITSIACLMVFAGCEKVIDLDLENADPVIVIDGEVSDTNGNHTVRISKTYGFTEPNRFNGIAGAKVVLTAAGVNTVRYDYVEVAPGIYRSPRFRGRPGVTYTLDVSYEGKEYSATSLMPAKVPLDSLSFKKLSFFGSANTYIAANYNDPAGTQNQYRYILNVKGRIEEDIVSDDRFTDGSTVSNTIFYELDDLISGDSIEVEFQCIDKNVYRYFFSLVQTSGGGGPPVAPADPPSNFNNGALGEFNACTSSKKRVVLQ